MSVLARKSPAAILIALLLAVVALGALHGHGADCDDCALADAPNSAALSFLGAQPPASATA